MMGRLAIVVMACVLVGSDSKTTDWNDLNGTWDVVRLEFSGKSLLERSAERQIVIQYGRISVYLNRSLRKQLSITLGGNQQQRTAEATFEFNSSLYALDAVFRQEQDEIEVCFKLVQPDLQKRSTPNGFDSEDKFLMTLKRVTIPGSAFQPSSDEKAIENSIGMQLVRIPNGEFFMGSILSGIDDEARHRVRLSNPFYMSRCEVSQKHYSQIMRETHASIDISNGNKVDAVESEKMPVNSVSWNDAVQFCKRLSALPAEAREGRRYRLPTEAEWEYACRAGSSDKYHVGRYLTSEDANVGMGGPQQESKSVENSGLMKSGSFRPNALGLFDMHGNVAEWCGDWYAGYYTSAAMLENPQGPLTGRRRVVRGGSYLSAPFEARSAARAAFDPNARDKSTGFRVVCELRNVAPDYERVRAEVEKQLHSCVWESAEVNRQTEHRSRYVAFELLPAERAGELGQVRVLMRFEAERDEGYLEWVMAGEWHSRVGLTRSAKTVHVHLHLFLTEILVRTVVRNVPGEWQRRDGITDPIFVELWGTQPPEGLSRELSLIFRSGVQLDENHKGKTGEDGKSVEADRFGWVPRYTKLWFRRGDSDSSIEWLGGKFSESWAETPLGRSSE